MRRIALPTSEPREKWLSSRIAHMLTCRHTLDELTEEIMADGSPLRQRMGEAVKCLYEHPTPNDREHHRAIGAIVAAFQMQATERAHGEWNRLFTSEHPQLQEAA